VGQNLKPVPDPDEPAQAAADIESVTRASSPSRSGTFISWFQFDPLSHSLERRPRVLNRDRITHLFRAKQAVGKFSAKSGSCRYWTIERQEPMGAIPWRVIVCDFGTLDRRAEKVLHFQ
jgi:hypothetical protein